MDYRRAGQVPEGRAGESCRVRIRYSAEGLAENRVEANVQGKYTVTLELDALAYKTLTVTVSAEKEGYFPARETTSFTKKGETYAIDLVMLPKKQDDTGFPVDQLLAALAPRYKTASAPDLKGESERRDFSRGVDLFFVQHDSATAFPLLSAVVKKSPHCVECRTVLGMLELQAGGSGAQFLNLMDTPGHVDFAYEVSRSLAACEGSLLVVDASQGVEAQTLANVYHALDAGHEIVPVLNKIDLPAAEPERIKEQIEDVIGLDAADAVLISAKTGLGIDDGSRGDRHAAAAAKGRSRRRPLKALLVDSWYDAYLGVVVLVRVIDGTMKKHQKILMMGTDAHYEIDRIGVFRPKMIDAEALGPGEIGFITAQIKQVADTRVGDTITDEKRHPVAEALPGFKPAQPVVFCGLFPVDAARFRRSARRGRASCASMMRASPMRWKARRRSASASAAAFSGFCISRSFRSGWSASSISTSSRRRLRSSIGSCMRSGETIELHNPVDMPDPSRIEQIEEPWIRATILTPDDYLGAVLKLCQDRRGVQVDLNYVGERAMAVYDLPLNEVVFDFYDRLKSISKGYASFDYTITDYREGDLVKMSILVNAEPVDALSMLVHRDRAEMRGRAMVEKLKELIPPHMFQIPIQAAIGGKIIARETVRALRKDVTAKCYGGDATRKRKLLEKQKAGKKKMRQFGKVEIPQEAFIAALKMDS